MRLPFRLCRSLYLLLAVALAAASPGFADEWRRLYPPLPVTPINDLHRIDAQTILTAGDDGAILRTSDGGASWVQIPTGVAQNLNALAFADEQRGVAVGDAGTVLLTRDGGQTWEKRPTPTLQDQRGAHFIDSLNGWSVGLDTTILRTSDGGESWTLQYSGLVVNNIRVGLLDVHFVDTTRGWATGMLGTVLHTADGGQNWAQQPTGQPTGILTDLSTVFFIDAQTGWAGGTQAGTNLWRTTDGGQTWEQVSFATSITPLHDIHFTGTSNGWLLGRNGRTWRTDDGGDTWEQLGLVNTSGTIVPFADGGGITFSDALNGWAAGGPGLISKTSDGGATWEVSLLVSADFPQALSASFLDAQRGWVGTSDGRTFRTSDGGNTWLRQPASGPPLTGRLVNMRFYNDSLGWALGAIGGISNRTGRVYRTTDGGSSWSQSSFPAGTAELTSVDFASDTLGLAVGAAGTILRSTDGGVTWTAAPSGSAQRLASVRFADPANAWVVGGSGTLLHSSDGGQSWSARDPGLIQNPGTSLNEIFFIDPARGWIAGSTAPGSSPVILHTLDGGESWTRQTVSSDANGFIVPYFGPLRGVSFADRLHGWSTGLLGQIARTSDGGESWLVRAQPPHSAPTEFNLTWVSLLQPDYGLVIDDGGNLRAFTGDPGGEAGGSLAEAINATCQDGWCFSAFYGWFSENEGWTYHLRHGWQFFGALRNDGIVLFDAGVGAWVQVGWLNPDVFHAWPPLDDWLIVSPVGTPGNRLFYSLKSGSWRTESDFQE